MADGAGGHIASPTVAVTTTGERIPFDLFLGIPVHKVPDVVEESGELLVHRVEDSLVEGALGVAPLVERWPERAVDVVGPEVDEERLSGVLCLFDEC